MARIKTEFCPNCGKGEIIRFPDTELDYSENCPVCGKDLTVPSDPKKPIVVRIYTVRTGEASLDAIDPWGAIFEGIKELVKSANR